jgi:hypothetical protein
MAQVNQRLWKIPGQRTKRKAWDLRSAVARLDTTLPTSDSAQETRVEEALLAK